MEPLFGSPSRGNAAETECIIPYIAVALRDLAMFEEVLDDETTHAGLDGEEIDCINFVKMRAVGDVVTMIQRFQVECRETVPVNIPAIPEMQAFLVEKVHSGETLDTMKLQSMANLIDPPKSGRSTGTLSRRVSSFFHG
jgi:hypothetical protein